jgi:hypothetical protein
MANSGTMTKFLPVPMLDFRREFATIREEVLGAIAEVCESQRFILGPEVERFEKAAATACGVTSAIGCASGTDALWLAMAQGQSLCWPISTTGPSTWRLKLWAHCCAGSPGEQRSRPLCLSICMASAPT